ncbi:hypothetical protein RRG08_034697 [Elysia crispata]|uniref:Uncharacterized protein n=1 Tax=Elysia crispata TaxID=231223 RepID=A0AAE0Z2D1_9GAST|nr:hypothetical protein RRG08_034697 [Elysia crispata]
MGPMINELVLFLSTLSSTRSRRDNCERFPSRDEKIACLALGEITVMSKTMVCGGFVLWLTWHNVMPTFS